MEVWPIFSMLSRLRMEPYGSGVCAAGRHFPPAGDRGDVPQASIGAASKYQGPEVQAWAVESDISADKWSMSAA
jgi:hypothetical protein